MTGESILNFAHLLGADLLGQADQTLLQRLGDVGRAKVMMALLGLVLIGITLVVGIYLGGRWARRIARTRVPVRLRDQSDWDRRSPLESAPESGEAKPGDKTEIEPSDHDWPEKSDEDNDDDPPPRGDSSPRQPR
ncbi:MAG: hypothetical protein SGJ20_09030 [Planctomycetota bacterium]|nr:hypothetical protein [Planctomycetota bacterium]